MTVKDPFLACALKLAELRGKPTSPNSLTVGLPLEMGLLTADLFMSAIERIEFRSTLIEKKLTEFTKNEFPCLIFLHNDQVALVKTIKDNQVEI